MKFYSETLNKMFDDEKSLVKAEKDYQTALEEKKKAEEAKKSERAARAEKVEAARKALIAARDAYSKELNDFCKDYGAYHFSVADGADFGISDLFKLLF